MVNIYYRISEALAPSPPRLHSNAVRCSHADCKHNQRLYKPGQERFHMYTHARKTLECNDPGCEDSDLLYNEESLRRHIYEHPIKLFCPFRDCGAPLSSWNNMRCHVFGHHNIQTTLAKLKAAVSTAFNVSLPGQLNIEMRSIVPNERYLAFDLRGTKYIV